MSTTDTTLVDRRTVLRATAAAGAAAVGGSALSGTATAQEDGFDGWFDNVANYDGIVDRTGNAAVTIEVGAEANGGPYGFGPAAVRVDPGTTVTWEWVGGTHNVVADDGSYESELTDEEGFAFSRTFEEEGVSKYYCMPHEGMGMKGAVVVGGSGGGGGGSSGGESGVLSTTDVGVLAFAGALVGGLLSPFALKASRSSPDGASRGGRGRRAARGSSRRR